MGWKNDGVPCSFVRIVCLRLQTCIFLLQFLALASANSFVAPAAVGVPLSIGAFHINHRHGTTRSENSIRTLIGADESSSSNAPLAEYERIVNEIVEILGKKSRKDQQQQQQHGNEDKEGEDDSNEDDDKEDEARLWKHLGKLCLDAREYAEASRIFRRGAERCPGDEGLVHHAKVYEAFHGSSKQEYSPGQERGQITAVPPPLQFNDQNLQDDVFLSFPIPPDKVPSSIHKIATYHASERTVDLKSLTRLLHASTEPILARPACRYIIDCANKAAKQRGWTTDRHVHAPTCDIPVFDLNPDAISWIRNAMEDVLFPLLAKTFPKDIGVKANKLRIQDLFVVRYDGTAENKPGFASLRPHEDESIISLTIALNDMSDYEGGGLFIASTGDLLNGDAGTVLTFAGEIVHGGYPVTKGTRWIMTVFLYLDFNLSGKDPGYTLQILKERLLANELAADKKI